MPKLKPNQFYLSGHLITERPLLFQKEMVQANLEDRKTQTRREKGLGYFNADPDFWFRKGNPRSSSNKFWDSNKEANPNPLSISFGFSDPLGYLEYVKSTYGKPGDLLWVRETWLKFDQDHIGTYAYKANSDSETEEIRKDYIKSGRKYQWKPSIYMPKKAARLWLMVEDIRVERVQDITEKDAIAEGIVKNNGQFLYSYYIDHNGNSVASYGKSPLIAFETLWESINGKASWDPNPWVWVIQYRILSKTGRPSPDNILENYLQITGKGKEVSYE